MPDPIPFPAEAGIREEDHVTVTLTSEEMDYVIFALLSSPGVAGTVGTRWLEARLTNRL